MNIKKLAIDLLFWLHLPFVVIWLGLFFVPRSVWLSKITFHFWYALVLLIIQLGWGLILSPITKKINIICPLTTIMQRLRGFHITSKKNFGHTYVAELSNKLNMRISNKAVNILALVTFFIILIQYAFFNS
ncbi:hypothetical protein CMO93_05035 [Candidatus Woesearchaeota archaeon]|nr:hypothetical protein [Candidatus Woesearchaeota archaeon]|tara:strand:+ start:1636 stop:2028 length:393 start_codon:yes stop_codon:yes gene_type:complete